MYSQDDKNDSAHLHQRRTRRVDHPVAAAVCTLNVCLGSWPRENATASRKRRTALPRIAILLQQPFARRLGFSR
jgi:hypothetical protein